MAIHNESLVRVVHVARGVGAMLIAGSLLFLALAAIPVIRHPSWPWPWIAFANWLSYILAGGTLLFSASRLDRGRAWAFYTIAAISAAGVIWSGASVLLRMDPRPAAIVLLMLIQATVCGIAWPEVRILRKRRSYAPHSPLPSTAVVIPPPPARIKENQLQP